MSDGQSCVHPRGREIAEPQRNVKHGELLGLRLWFCPDCGEKWDTCEKLGDVDSITVSINLT